MSGHRTDSLDVAELLSSLTGEAPSGHEKTASANTNVDSNEPMDKLASELRAAGAEMADGFISQLEKVAADKASSSHAVNGMTTGGWGSIVERQQKAHDQGTPGDEGHIRAEQAYSRTIGKLTGKGGPESYGT